MPSSSSGSDGGGSKRIRKAGVISSTIRTVAAVAALGAMSAAFSGMSPKKAYQAEQAKLKRRQRDGARLAAKALAAVVREDNKSRLRIAANGAARSRRATQFASRWMLFVC